MNTRTLPLTVAEYFAGIGLMRLGLEPLGWRVVWANDISAKKYEMYRDFFPDAANHYRLGDIFRCRLQQIHIEETMTQILPLFCPLLEYLLKGASYDPQY